MATSTVEVFVKLQSGRAVSSTFGPHDTVAEITSFVAREEGGVPDQRVRLKYQGKVLDTRKTIDYLGIRPETILRGEVSKRFYLFACWVIFHAFLSSAHYFHQNQLFRKIISGIPSECPTVCIQIRPQTICKGYQQITLASRERVKT